LQDHAPADYVENLFIQIPNQILRGEKIETKIREPDMLDETFIQKMVKFLKYGV